MHIFDGNAIRGLTGKVFREFPLTADKLSCLEIAKVRLKQRP